MICRITKDFNTGWMLGDIQGAFMSDTDTTNITGTNLYLDNFSNNDKGWSFADNGSSGTIEIGDDCWNASARATDYDAHW